MQEKDKITSAQQEYFTNVLELHILFDLQKSSMMRKGTLPYALLLQVHPSDAKEIIHFPVVITSDRDLAQAMDKTQMHTVVGWEKISQRQPNHLQMLTFGVQTDSLTQVEFIQKKFHPT